MPHTYGRRLLLMKILESKDVISRTLRVAGRRPKIFRILVFAYSAEKSFAPENNNNIYLYIRQYRFGSDVSPKLPKSLKTPVPPNPPGSPPHSGEE